MQLTQNFNLKEFVPKAIYEQYRERSIWFIDIRLPAGAQAVYDVLKKAIIKPLGEFENMRMVINDQDSDERGFRFPDTATGASLSQHKFGRAIDFQIDVQRIGGGRWEAYPSLEVQWLISRPETWDILKVFFTTMEKDTIGWTHLDMRNRPFSEYSKKPALVPIPKH
jgi:hypothetical protein